MRKFTALLVVVGLVGTLVGSAAAQTPDWPKRAISVLIGFAPGGGSDVMLSMVRPLLEKKLNTTLVPVYKPGSGADIAFTELSLAKPDGYTIAITTTPQVPINPVVRQTQYKLADFIFTANVVTDPGIFVVRTESPYKSLADAVKAMKEKPGTVSVGVSSAPGDDWFAIKMIEGVAQVTARIVAFSGDGPSWQAALAGHVEASANNLSIVYPQVKAGKLRALALMADKRSPYLPDVPTFKELGYDFTSGSSRGFSFPKGTPKAIVDAFAAAVKEVMESAEFKANAEKTAFPMDYQDAAAYAAYVQKLDSVYKPLWEKYGKEATAGK